MKTIFKLIIMILKGDKSYPPVKCYGYWNYSFTNHRCEYSPLKTLINFLFKKNIFKRNKKLNQNGKNLN